MSNKLPVSSEGFLSSSDFDGDGQVFKVREPAEYKEANKPQFGDDNDKAYYYYFTDKDGNDVQLNNTSKRLARAWNEADVEVGDTVHIKAEGQGFDRTYTCTKLEGEDVPF